MIPPRPSVFLLIALLGLTEVVVVRADHTEVVVTPEESNEVLANPGMGWETFQCTSKQDKNLPSWIPSTILRVLWGWGELEPQPGKIDYGLIDKLLKECREAGQQLTFRVMCCSTSKRQPYHPKWLKEIGGRELQADHSGVSPLPIPDMDDPTVLERHLDFIKRLGERYDGHADIDHIDLGSIGWWGEWHLSRCNSAALPSLESRKKVVDAYVNAFRKTPLLMLIGDKECLRYATERGTGWRADCLGDLGGFSNSWCHMRHGYPFWLQRGGCGDAWKTAPVAWETCWDMRRWVQEGWSLRYIFNYALAFHGSYLTNKSEPLPAGPEVRSEIERFLRRLGYRLVLRELKHPARVQSGGKMKLAMNWQNVGSAPCYRPYRLAYRLTGDNGVEKVFLGSTTVNHWLSGSSDLSVHQFIEEPKDLPLGPVNEVAEAVTVPEDLPLGKYVLSIAVVDGMTGKPVLKLGIQGRAEDGWYPLSKTEVISQGVSLED